MERLKDFLYNKNDIIVALIILAIALALIAFRVQAIMEYPKTLAEEQAQAIENVQGDEKETKKDK